MKSDNPYYYCRFEDATLGEIEIPTAVVLVANARTGGGIAEGIGLSRHRPPHDS